METYVKVNVSVIIPIQHGEGAVNTYLENMAVEDVRAALAEINTVSEVEISDIAGIVQRDTMQEFVSKLVDLTYCSTEYAVAAYYTLQDHDKDNPERAAINYVRRFNLSRKSFE